MDLGCDLVYVSHLADALRIFLLTFISLLYSSCATFASFYCQCFAGFIEKFYSLIYLIQRF